METYQALLAGKHRLVPHPATPAESIDSVEVEVLMTDHEDILLCFRVRGEGELSLSPWLSSERVDGLWRTTCFELFLKPEASEGYFEFNFSPSTQWAAYAFDGHRDGKRDMALTLHPHIDRDPPLEPEDGDVVYALEVDVELADIPPVALRLGLSAVIEEKSGIKSYWALAHPPGAPDFHHPDCFALNIPAPDAA